MSDYQDARNRMSGGWIFGGLIILLVVLYLVLSTGMRPAYTSGGSRSGDTQPPVRTEAIQLAPASAANN